MKLTDAQVREAVSMMDADEKARAKMLRLALAGDNGMRFILHATLKRAGRI